MPFGRLSKVLLFVWGGGDGSRTGDVQCGSCFGHQAPWAADVEELAWVVDLYAERRGVVWSCLAACESDETENSGQGEDFHFC